MSNKVKILRDGYAYKTATGEYKANCTITLIRGKNKNIVVDTGLPADKEFIIQALKDNGLGTEDIHIVVGTHGHSDHIGNLNLFPHSLIIVSCDICQGDVFLEHSLQQDDEPYPLDDAIELVYSPGHTGRDVSVIVRDTELGTVSIVGDLFESEDDIADSSVWRETSENPDLQLKYRHSISARADYIVPGHGPMFKLLDRHREILKL